MFLCYLASRVLVTIKPYIEYVNKGSGYILTITSFPSIPHLTLLIMQYIHYRCSIGCFMSLHKIYFGHKLSETNSTAVNPPPSHLY